MLRRVALCAFSPILWAVRVRDFRFCSLGLQRAFSLLVGRRADPGDDGHAAARRAALHGASVGHLCLSSPRSASRGLFSPLLVEIIGCRSLPSLCRLELAAVLLFVATRTVSSFAAALHPLPFTARLLVSLCFVPGGLRAAHVPPQDRAQTGKPFHLVAVVPPRVVLPVSFLGRSRSADAR